MKKIKNKKPMYIIVIICTIMIVIISILLYRREKETYKFPISIINRNGENYEYEDIEYKIIYNTVMVPINEVFKGIFCDVYKENANQIITYKDTTIEIKFDENKIILPQIDEKGKYKIDNTVEIEIENIDGNKYIPIYLISNLPGIIVKIDNKIVYYSEDYLNGTEVINKKKDKHKIVIFTDQNKKEKNVQYIGEENGALWREEAFKRIEKYRKKNITLIIKNQYEAKIKDAQIPIKLKKNKFLFGTSIRGNDYKDANKYFNIIGSENNFKRSFIEKYGTSVIEELENYAKNNNLKYRLHNIWWDMDTVPSLKKFINIENAEENDNMEQILYDYENKISTLEECEKRIDDLIIELENDVYNYVDEVTKTYNNSYEIDVVNEIIGQQYFKYYLFDKNFLNDKTFLTKSQKYLPYSTYNDVFYKFLANCFEIAHQNNNNAHLVLNDNLIYGRIYTEQDKEIIKEINNIKKYTKNIDTLGVQYHVENYYMYTPQSYFNAINSFLKDTNINNAEITEYDNYLVDRKNNYTSEEKKVKANYLKDALISSYSNMNIYGFNFWVYYSDHFCDEERKAYEETVYPWLNYSEEGTTTEEGYSTRLYKGTYTATVTLPNGKTKDIEFTVSDDTSDTVEVIIDSEITNVKIKQQPSKIKYYRNDNIDLTDGVLEISYDDGTTKELAMNDSNINTAGFDSSVLGKQTIKLNYKGHEITFEIEVEESQDNLIKTSIQNIENGNIKLKNNYNYISNNIEILNSYNSIISKINELKQNIKNIDNSKINELYKSEFDLASKIIDEYNKKTINISEEDLKNVLNNITELTSNYTELYKYYFNNDTIDNEQITNSINELIDRYNYNKDIQLPLELYYINQVKDIYNNNITGQNNYENYLNKRRIQNTCTIISKMLENKIKETAQQEAQKIGIAYNIDPSTLTNKDVTAQIKLPNSKSSIESNPNNEKYTFTENGTKNITINIRGYKYNYNIKVTNIDKTPPQIIGIEQDGKYKESATPQITDENLSEVKLIKDGQEVENYKQNTAITQEGIYQLKATDKAGNETSINFVIAYPEDEKYKIENNTIKNIKGETSVEILKGKLQVDEKYTIKRKDTEIQNSDNIATGDILETESGNKYTLIVRGDLNKDGKVDIKDLVKMRKFLLLGNNLDESEEMAADTNLDGKEISIKDLVKMRIILLTQ